MKFLAAFDLDFSLQFFSSLREQQSVNATSPLKRNQLPYFPLAVASYAPHDRALHGARAKDPHQGFLFCSLVAKVNFWCVFCFVALFFSLSDCDLASLRVLFSPDARLLGQEETLVDPSERLEG